MRTHVDAGAGIEQGRAHLVDEHERTDAAGLQ